MRRFSLFGVLLAAGSVAAMPTLDSEDFVRRDTLWNTTVCSTDELSIIKEWTNMTSTEKSDYITAEKCLWALPSTSGLIGATTRFEDLVALHQNMTPIIHAVGQFLPYHRLYMKLHEHLLRTECDYEGPMTWWDETRDAGNFMNSPILDPDTGFGGNGSATDYCVIDGPFANSTCHLGPLTTYTPEGFCLKRKVDEENSAGAAQDIIDGCMEITDYSDACTWCIGYKPHTAGHGGLGGGVLGSMGDIYTSPNDPLFYLHHAFIDRLWWKWQSADIENRRYAIDGYTRYPSTNISVTLDYELDLLGLWDNKLVGDVMDLHNSFLCHEYDY